MMEFVIPEKYAATSSNMTVSYTVEGAKTVANLIEGGTWVEVKPYLYTFTVIKSVNTTCQLWEHGWTVHNKVCGTTTYHQVVDYETGETQHTKYEWMEHAQRKLDLHLYGKMMEFQEDDVTREKRIKNADRRRMREIIKSRCFPGIVIKPTRTPLSPPPDLREQAARETLRRVIGEDQWRRFVKNGFIQVRAKSGRYYQIFPGSGMTKVFENGTLIQKLCIVLNADFPATDSVIMRYLMVLNNEEDFWKRSVKHMRPHTENMWPDFDIPPAPTWNFKTAPLTEVAKLIKVA